MYVCTCVFHTNLGLHRGPAITGQSGSRITASQTSDWRPLLLSSDTGLSQFRKAGRIGIFVDELAIRSFFCSFSFLQDSFLVVNCWTPQVLINLSSPIDLHVLFSFLRLFLSFISSYQCLLFFICYRSPLFLSYLRIQTI